MTHPSQTPPPPPSAPQSKAPMRLWLRLVLFGSLALNLLIIGTVVSFVATHGPRESRRGPPRADQMGGPLTAALSHEDKRAIGRAIRNEYRQRADRPSRARVREEYRAVVAALRAQPYDPEPVRESLARQLAFASERQGVGNRLLLERLAAMSAQDRRAFADRIEEALERKAKFEERKD